MSVIKLEALADTIGLANGIQVPDSRAYRNRNPGELKSFALLHKQDADEEGYRIFSSFIGGYRALLHELKVRCSGHGRASVWDGDKNAPKKLSSTSPLKDLLRTYGMKSEEVVTKTVNFLRKALRDEVISAEIQIGWFVDAPLVPQGEILRRRVDADAIWLGQSYQPRGE